MLDCFFLGVKEFEAKWIGWAGVNVPDEVGQRSLTKALAEKVLHPGSIFHAIFGLEPINLSSLVPTCDFQGLTF